jgi:hypothetical protein
MVHERGDRDSSEGSSGSQKSSGSQRDSASEPKSTIPSGWAASARGAVDALTAPMWFAIDRLSGPNPFELTRTRLDGE